MEMKLNCKNHEKANLAIIYTVAENFNDNLLINFILDNVYFLV